MANGPALIALASLITHFGNISTIMHKLLLSSSKPLRFNAISSRTKAASTAIHCPREIGKYTDRAWFTVKLNNSEKPSIHTRNIIDEPHVRK